MATRVISKTIDLNTPIEEISKYITSIDQNGINIHPENSEWENNNYIQITGDGFSIYNQEKPIAQYGRDAIIGNLEEFHIKITTNYISYILSNDTVVNNNKTYYIRHRNSYEEVSEPTGNPKENGYYEQQIEPRLSFYRDNENEVAYISGDKLYITQSVVLEQMDVGRSTKELDSFGDPGKGQWSWRIHEYNNANNLYLKWLE